tara:strand:- start:1831 stop:1989 length:159 start_codon:yes stop_codon:yes gene_type:complete
LYNQLKQQHRVKAEYGKSLSPGYASYLQNKSAEIGRCEHDAIKQVRKTIPLN